ncbi:MAG: ExbD/TolR family protein [Alkalispirochaeta sp.]
MRFQRRLQPMVNVDLIPMIDVVFQLVVFFMLSSTLITRAGLNLDLPDAGSAQEAVTSSVVLSVVSEEEIYIGSDRYTIGELAGVLEDNREDYESRSIAVEADRTIPYGTMVQVLDVLRRNGFRGANLVTREPLDEES